MNRFLLVPLYLFCFIALGALNAYTAPLPPPPTPVGGDFWPYMTTGAVIGIGALRLWRK